MSKDFESLVSLMDAYVELRHKNGNHSYNSVTYDARKVLLEKLKDVVTNSARYEWLKYSKWNEHSHPEVWVQVTNEYGELDVAIDSAMKQGN